MLEEPESPELAVAAELTAETAAAAGKQPARRPSLWRHADFMNIWSAATVSLMGSAVSQIAIPFIAAFVLRSSPLEVSLLGAVQMAPFLMFALPAGAWLDRVRRRPVLIAGDFGRGLALLTIPVAYVAGALTIWQLFAVAFVTGFLTVLFDVADQSYLPVLIDREDLVQGNAKLSLSQSSAQIVGPALGGGLVGLIGAAIGSSAFLWVLASPVRSLREIPKPTSVEATSE